MANTVGELYFEIVGFTRTGKNAEEIQKFVLEQHGLGVSRSAITSNLRLWVDAGAFILKTEKVQNTVPTVGGPADGHYGSHREHRFFSNAVALEPGIMARAIGVRKANAVLERLGHPPIQLDPPSRPPLQPQLVPYEEPEREPRRAEVREPEVPPRQQLPDMLFGAQFTASGVLISYEQFHRVIALLQHATED